MKETEQLLNIIRNVVIESASTLRMAKMNYNQTQNPHYARLFHQLKGKFTKQVNELESIQYNSQ